MQYRHASLIIAPNAVVWSCSSTRMTTTRESVATACALAGTYIAYTSTTIANGGRYDAVPAGTISIRNALTGKTSSVNPLRACGFAALAVATDGIGAWQANACVALPAGGTIGGYVIRALDSRNGTITTLASTGLSTYAIDPFAHLSVASCRTRCTRIRRGAPVSWTVNGTRATRSVG
jgi:hypothetical protein